VSPAVGRRIGEWLRQRIRVRDPSLGARDRLAESSASWTLSRLADELFRQAKTRAALDGMKLKDLITRFVEQGRPGVRGTAQAPAQRASCGASGDGRTLPTLTNADSHSILEEEETSSGRSY